jgi:GT2 family glycosyltransferase
MYHNNKHAFGEASDYQAYGHNFNHYITTLKKKESERLCFKNLL